MANILSIGQTALTAAQVGLSTTGHNIANAGTEGYSRQITVQANIAGEQSNFGFLGKGAQVTVVKRIYNEFIAGQVLNSQTSQNALSSYYTRISQINNMFADPTVGVSPALQDFFAGVQNLAAAPPASSGPARQTLISSAETLVGQFQGMDGRLDQLRDGVNSDIKASIDSINSIATQIAKLNNAISTVQASSGKPPNDLLDQRDKLVSDLSKEIKVTVVKQDNDYNISIGNGQALIVGGKTFELAPTISATDPTRIGVGYKNNGGSLISLSEASLTGGKLGGLLEFRSQTLDQVQNELGRVAIGLAAEFNAQHRLGQDLNGAPGEDFFKVAVPLVNSSSLNSGNAQVSVDIVDAGALTASDYRFEFVGPAEYRVTRLSDGAIETASTVPLSFDGLDFKIDSGSMAPGDVFLVKPTVNGASSIGVLLNDTAKLAAGAAPVLSAAGTANAGTGTVTAARWDASYSPATVTPAITLSYSAGTGELSGFPAVPVSVTNNGTTTNYAAGVPVPYTDGATISFGGISFAISGSPADGDNFTVGANATGMGDNRNMLLLGELQTRKLLDSDSVTLQGAFGQMVNMVGNKSHELDVNMNAENTLLAQAVAAQQSESGVNLDEEAANLLRYQQAYQAAGKVMQTASKLFDVLLSLGQ